MKRFLKGILTLGLIFALSGISFAVNSIVTTESDWIRINTGGRHGVMNRNDRPLFEHLKINGTDTTAASTEVSTGEAIIEYVPATLTTESASLNVLFWTNYQTTFEGSNAYSSFSLPLNSGFDANWGDITNVGTPDANFEAATKLYVDTGDSTKLPLAGGTMTGILTVDATAGMTVGGAAGLDQTIYITAEGTGYYLTFEAGVLTGYTTE